MSGFDHRILLPRTDLVAQELIRQPPVEHGVGMLIESVVGELLPLRSEDELRAVDCLVHVGVLRISIAIIIMKSKKLFKLRIT